MAEINPSNTINVSLSKIPTGLGEPNTASMVIFSNENANKSGEIFTAGSANEVAELYGSNSRTYAMAVGALGQTPSFKTPRGQLYICPFVSKNATRGSVKTIDISDHIAVFGACYDGVLNIKVNGIAKLYKAINFTGCTDLGDVAKVLDSLGMDVEITVEGTSIVFTSKLHGAESKVEILEAPTGTSGVDLYSATLLAGSEMVATNGTNHQATEELKDAIARINAKLDYGVILTTQELENDAVIATAQSVQTMDRLFAYPVCSLDNISQLGEDALGTQIKLAGLDKTRTLALSNSVEEAFVAIAGYMSIAEAPNFKGSNTANTLNLKSIAGSTPDKYLTQAYYNDAKKEGVDIYGVTGGLSCVYSFDNGKYTDEAVADLWLKRQLEVQLFNVLRQTNTKVPQTETGITALKTVAEKVMQMHVDNGSLGVGLKWQSVERFGDPEDFDRNITEKGYFVYTKPIAEQDQVEREARIAPLMQIAGKRAGAVHHADVIVVLER